VGGLGWGFFCVGKCKAFTERRGGGPESRVFDHVGVTNVACCTGTWATRLVSRH
jgi:hypothetical protein